MVWTGSLLLLVAAAFANAARPLHQRQQVVILPPALPDGLNHATSPKSLGEKQFTLRHIYHHGSHDFPNLHRYIDVPTHAKLKITSDDGETFETAPETLRAKAQPFTVQRLAKRSESDINDLLAHADWFGTAAELSAEEWTEDEIPGPNITDKETVLTFAKMAANAYVQDPADPEWQPVKGGFNYTDDFGWELDGLRGHIFADETNGTVVIGLKGTSPAVFDGADTTGNDKLNDNLFGSCCCGQGGQLMWKSVCTCMTGTYTCNNTCLVNSLRERGHYYNAVRELYSNVTERYPNSDIWLSGHSLGGVVSSLLGLTYGLPTLTFETFPDALAASRLGLPTPPGFKIGSHQTRARTGVYHFGHTADPIYMGACNGATAFCTIGGYAFEGLCHTGQTCIYDTVNDLGWRVGIGTHKISNVIKDVLKKYDTVPTCDADVDCQDCLLWKFYENNRTVTTTRSSATSTSSYSRTRTETCKTPGWWGCLDESTTTGRTATATTTTTLPTSTSTCKTPGWFGCYDKTTTTSKTSSKPSTITAPPTLTPSTTRSAPSSSTTCKTPGWFGGCWDDEPTTTTKRAQPRHSSTLSSPATRTSSTSTTATDSCTSREWFGLICVDPSPTPPPSAQPSSPNLPTTRRKKCVRKHWYGSCAEWRVEDFDLGSADL